MILRWKNYDFLAVFQNNSKVQIPNSAVPVNKINHSLAPCERIFKFRQALLVFTRKCVCIIVYTFLSKFHHISIEIPSDISSYSIESKKLPRHDIGLEKQHDQTHSCPGDWRLSASGGINWEHPLKPSIRWCCDGPRGFRGTQLGPLMPRATVTRRCFSSLMRKLPNRKPRRNFSPRPALAFVYHQRFLKEKYKPSSVCKTIWKRWEPTAAYSSFKTACYSHSWYSFWEHHIFLRS